jgi:endonuclease/exonuclease/phosphatase family metal-dependent hydrolase
MALHHRLSVASYNICFGCQTDDAANTDRSARPLSQYCPKFFGERRCQRGVAANLEALVQEHLRGELHILALQEATNVAWYAQHSAVLQNMRSVLTTSGPSSLALFYDRETLRLLKYASGEWGASRGRPAAVYLFEHAPSQEHLLVVNGHSAHGASLDELETWTSAIVERLGSPALHRARFAVACGDWNDEGHEAWRGARLFSKALGLNPGLRTAWLGSRGAPPPKTCCDPRLEDVKRYARRGDYILASPGFQYLVPNSAPTELQKYASDHKPVGCVLEFVEPRPVSPQGGGIARNRRKSKKGSRRQHDHDARRHAAQNAAPISPGAGGPAAARDARRARSQPGPPKLQPLFG